MPTTIRCLLAALAVWAGACTSARDGACVVGASAPCTCSDGRMGAQVCQAGGDFEACVCLGPGPGPSPDAGVCASVSEERCDGLDNDCDGRADDGEVCPDATVAHTLPFTGGVYLQGTTAESTCGADALQRFWPTLSPTYFHGFDCRSGWYRFRRSDHAIYYQATFSGIRQDNSTDDPAISTPPCYADVRSDFDFDAAGTLYYQCDNTVRRGNGAFIADSIRTLAATLDDGRILVTRTSGDGNDFIVLGPGGQELSRLSPRGQFVGTMTAVPQATTVVGNRAYVAFLRQYADDRREIVVFRVDEGSAWAKVRRVPVESFGFSLLALSDGTVFVRERDPATIFDDRIVVYPPGDGSHVIWREAEQTVVRTHGGYELLIGPP
jgi:hypothetical protein